LPPELDGLLGRLRRGPRKGRKGDRETQEDDV
jgi:hypothetical protein